jgi:hypothetical protein
LTKVCPYEHLGGGVFTELDEIFRRILYRPDLGGSVGGPDGKEVGKHNCRGLGHPGKIWRT